jgi:hypothetical protein
VVETHLLELTPESFTERVRACCRVRRLPPHPPPRHACNVQFADAETKNLSFSVRASEVWSALRLPPPAPHARPLLLVAQAVKADGEGILVYFAEGDVGLEACKASVPQGSGVGAGGLPAMSLVPRVCAWRAGS